LTLHKYLYCRNEPINKIDWNGQYYFDLNASWSLGTIRGGMMGAAIGSGNKITAVLGALAGAYVGSTTFTFGAMYDQFSRHYLNVNPYIGVGRTISYGGWTLTGTVQPQPGFAEPGWYYALTITLPLSDKHGAAFQSVWKQETWEKNVVTGESYRPDAVEVGWALGNYPSLSLTRFRVFDKWFSRSEQLDQAVMLGIALDELAAAEDLGMQERYMLLGGTLMMSGYDFNF
jgi:hypothetical protein